jgi:hypothetical protein
MGISSAPIEASKSLNERRLFFILIATMVRSVAMRVELASVKSGDFKRPVSCSYFSAEPILDLELASSPSCFLSVVQQGGTNKLSPNAKAFRYNTYMDYVFIVLYWTVFVLFARSVGGRWSNWVAGFISVSALFDILENARILRGLRDLLASGSVQGVLPRPFSLVKWTFLALALGWLGVLLWSGVQRGSRLLSAALFAAGVLTLGGLVIPKVMAYSVYLFALVLLLSVVRFWSYSLNSFLVAVEYAFLMRFQVLAALILALGLPIGYYVIPSLFVGLFDGRGFWSFAFIVWAAFQLAWTIMVTCRLVLVYGPERFARAKSIVVAPEEAGQAEQAQNPADAVEPVRIRTVAAFGLLAFPLVAVLCIGTSEPGGMEKLLSALLGLFIGICVLGITAALHFSIEDKKGKSAESVFPSFGFLRKQERPNPSWLGQLVGSLLARLGPDLTAGILKGDRLRSGHEMAGIALGVFLVAYAAVGWFFSPTRSTPEHEPAALFFLLFVLTIFTWFFSGAAFFLDRTRLPVLSTLLAVSLLTGFFGTDHKFEIIPTSTDAGMLRPSGVIRAWKEIGRGKTNSQTITIVATAGGGIRAAAWTAEVMTRLQEECPAFSSSVLLVSSVSGGSVGSMFVVAPYSADDGSYPVAKPALQHIREFAARSSLGAVGWGLAYPDLARTVPFFGSLVRETLDRGWALENAWSSDWPDANHKPPSMSDWRKDVRLGRRPAVIFNATVSESGERFLVSSTDAGTESSGTERFFHLFPDADISVATAARLSATFPYVSPLARPSVGSVSNGYHVGDGGYYDNSGLLSAVEWLRDAKDAIDKSTVLLVLIDAKPGEPRSGGSWSWQKQMVGPIETLLHVRTSSQQLRDSIELQMATDFLAAQTPKVTVIPAPFLFWSESPVPLSWHLTKQQIEEIGIPWGYPQNVKSAELVYDKLGCNSTKKAAGPWGQAVAMH